MEGLMQQKLILEDRMKSPARVLQEIADKNQLHVQSKEFASFMDQNDPLKDFRKKFAYPKNGTLKGTDPALANPEDDSLYLCSQAMGLKPRTADREVQSILERWGGSGVQMYFHEPVPALYSDRYGRESLGRLVGADPCSVVLMNSLTVNLHLLMLSFYQPTPQRYKIVIEAETFPSDRYAMVSQAELRGYSPEEAVIEIHRREGERTIRNEDVIELLEREGSSIAVVCMSGVHYCTGQKFDMAAITRAGRKAGCMVGWDLAHAIGNVNLELDNWGVDFAFWGANKYLNSGPGGVGGAYVNKRHNGSRIPSLRGWFSNKEATRLQMKHRCDLDDGVDSFRLSSPSSLLIPIVLASLKIFDEAGMPRLLEKQYLLTGYLELLIKSHLGSNGLPVRAEIVTPEDVNQRGCQLSLVFNTSLTQVLQELTKRGVVCDVRPPNVMRVTPSPLYNTFSDVHTFVSIIKDILATCRPDNIPEESCP